MKSLIFLDVETTGLSSKRDRIIEIYMLKVAYEGDVEEYHTFINPERQIPGFITNLTGITNADVADAPTESQIAKNIRDFIGDGVLVAHNLSFDRRFLAAMFERNHCQPLPSGGIDTLGISMRLFPKLCIYPKGEGSSLRFNVSFSFRADFANSHRAKDDVLLLVQVYRHLENMQKELPYTYPRAMTHGCPRWISYAASESGEKGWFVLKDPAAASA